MLRSFFGHRWIAGFVLAGLAVVSLTNRAAADDRIAARDALYGKYQQALGELAQWCDEHKLPEAAAQTRAWFVPRDPLKLYVFVVPESFAAPAETQKSPDAAKWWESFGKLRTEQAAALFELSKQAVAAKQWTLAYALAQETARENPDHEAARRILGDQKYEDRWVTPFAARKLKAGEEWSEKFGWLPAGYGKRYDQGERYAGNRWITADADAKLHATIDGGWRIETEHFRITTDHSLEEGVRLGKRLELLHMVWREVFAAYYGSKDLPKVFDGGAWPRERRPHLVTYYRDRAEYTRALQAMQANAAATLGTYFDKSLTTCFFAGKDQDEATVFHEATHQLFRESRGGVSKDLGRKNNVWIIEGIACYMESLTVHDGYYTLGGFDAGRMPAARKRMLDPGFFFYLPLAKLTPLGLDALQHDPQVPMIYTESTGLATFLMHFEQGRYRPALEEYLEAVYSGRANEATLAKLTGQTYETLDRQYKQFLQP